MIALSVRAPWSLLIATGAKEIEYRSWSTSHRGDLLIVQSTTIDRGACVARGVALSDVEPWRGRAVCVVRLVDVVQSADRDWHWILERPRMVRPFPVRGRLRLFDVPDARIKLDASAKIERAVREYKPPSTTAANVNRSRRWASW